MSDEQVTQEPVAEAPAGKKAKRQPNVTVEAAGFKIYQSTEKHTYPFDIMVKGETINGQWSASDGFVEFSVPDHLVEGFEKHFHFVSGNVVAA